MSGDDDVLPLGAPLPAQPESSSRAARRDGERHFPGLAARVDAAVDAHTRDPSHELIAVGRFELLEFLGEGGFGAVYEARDTELDRLVALKLCPARSVRAAEAIKREARALAQLRHPNIIAVHDVGWHERLDALFLVTEYVRSASLFEHAVRKRRAWREVLDIFLLAGEALAAAHDERVIHGDFKPGNVIVDERNDIPYIVDFGLARVLAPGAEALEHAVKRGGTLPYRAPELLRGGVSSELSDQYAFCVSLWECLDRGTPYVGDDTDELLEDIDTLGRDVCFFDKSLPAQLQEVLVVGLAEEPGDRYPNMRALLRALELAREAALASTSMRDEIVTLTPAHAEPDAGPRSNWRGAAVGLALVLSCLGILGGLYGLYLHRQVPDMNPTPAYPIESSFEEAEAALEAGDLQGCYNEWLGVYTELVEKDPAQAGRRSLELANRVANTRPGTTTAAWLAVGAADAFEKVSDSAAWEQATRCRIRAAELYTAAGQPDNASLQEACEKKNRAHQSCQ